MFLCIFCAILLYIFVLFDELMFSLIEFARNLMSSRFVGSNKHMSDCFGKLFHPSKKSFFEQFQEICFGRWFS